MTARRASAKPDRKPRRSEVIDLRTADGWSLRADVHEPGARPDHPRGVAVLAHGTMARRDTFDRPAGHGVVHWLVEQGWRVVAFDFRGHGDSGPAAHEGGSYTYDDLVTRDLPTVHAFARSRQRRGRPVILVGHSLGGPAALAAQGTELVEFDGIVLVAANVWLRKLEPSPARWLVKRATLSAALALSGRLGRFPARALGLGSDDECASCLADIVRYARTGAWTSSDGATDYFASLARVGVPLLQVVSEGDLLACVPECGERFIRPCGGPSETLRVTRSDDGGPAPNHDGLVTSENTRAVWQSIESWMRRVPVIK